jgi:hypothetical protein
MIEQYYTQEQIQNFRKTREADPELAAERAQQGTADLTALLEQYRMEMEAGTDPADPRLQALEQRRQELVDPVHRWRKGDRAGIEQNLKRLWTEQGDKLCAQYGMDAKVVAQGERSGREG